MQTIKHREKHESLDAALDELVVDFLRHNKNKSLPNTSILELMQWSAKQSLEPTEYEES